MRQGTCGTCIYFPFDMVSDTATEVAEEMGKDLDITNRYASEIAAMIEQDIERLVPGREQQHTSTRTPHKATTTTMTKTRSVLASVLLPLFFSRLLPRLSLRGGALHLGRLLWPTWQWLVQR
jgi:hypothetical protein